MKNGLWFTKKKLTFVVLIVSLLITQSIAYLIYQTQKEKEFIQVEQEVNRLKNQLDVSLSHSVTATKIMAYLIQNDLLGNRFDEIAAELLEQNNFIDAVQFVQGSSIINTYPLEGNELSIGYEILEVSSHRREAMLALERGDLYFEGPIELIQGGRGVVGRYPILLDDEYWGFSAVIIKYDTILKAIGADSTGSNDTFTYQIAKVSESESPIVFFEDRHFTDNGVYATAFVPFGNWEIQSKLNDPVHLKTGLLFSAIGLVLTIVLVIFIWYLVGEPKRLQRLVDKKTGELNRSNRMLEESTKKLQRSNHELEQFAYVASHDLQEPLRMVTSFLAQLERKYDHLLDEKGKKYIHFASDGAIRMRQIILDLLDYSRVGRVDSARDEVDINNILKVVKSLHKKLIEEKKASVTWGEMPVIYSARGPMQQLFQNLIHNALKYQDKGNKPVIKIRAEQTISHWKFFVKDNGIGIDPEYKDKIFNIFQRLHGRDEYSGTGVGLAVCKKIVEDHGGEIGVESKPGKGSTFYFTIAKNQSKVENNE